MLKGDVIYKTKHYSDGTDYNAKFYIEGADTSDKLTMRISTNDYEAVGVMNGNPDYEELQTRRFDVKMATIQVETVLAQVTLKNGTSKISPRPVNNDLFVRLGATLRYAKSKCTSKNAEDYSSLSLISTEFYPNTCQLYNIPDGDGNKLGTVILDKGAIMRMDISTPLFEIHLKDEKVFDMEAFAKSSCNKNMGFKMNEDTLGFKPVEKVRELGSSDGVVGLYKNLDEVIKYNPERDFEWLRGKNYIIVSDDNLEEICSKIMAHEGYVIYDTETTGLNITFKSREGKADILVGVVLSIEYGTSYFFPVNMRSITNLCGGDDYYFMENYMRPILEGKELVAHNMSYDWKVSYIYGINANIVHDTMALFQLTYGAEIEDFKIGLKDLARMFLHRDSLELSDLVRDGSWGDDDDIKFWDLPYELVRLYACADTDNTLGLLQYAINNDLLHKYNATKIYEIEVAFSYAVGYQEFYGHCADVSRIEQLKKDVDEGINKNKQAMEEIVGHTFNPNSPKDLMQVMYVELGIPEQISRKTGNPTTDKNAIKALLEMTDENEQPLYPFVKYLSEYRAFDGLRKNFIKNLHTLCTEDGFMFSHVMQYGTTTGRVSINKPNYQSYNDTIKKYIIPREGYYATDQDYSSVEYRVLGNMSGNTMIKEGFVDPDFDYHQYQAARMYNLPYASVTKKMRKRAKSINFGLPYGMGDESLGVSIFGEATKENTRQAAYLRKKYFEGQEDIKDFFEKARARGVKNGYTETYFGRRRYYNRNKFSVAAIRRQAGNQVVQGCIEGDTLIETEQYGVLKIKDVVNYSGKVWNGDGWTHGDVVYSGKKQKCIIQFTNGQKFVCSPIHKFLVGDDADNIECYKECKDLKSGDEIQCNTKSKLTIKGNIKDKICVESVEITDEYIDMYDVCNTDRGYYVADGVITHNTAADIYKLAVGRLFKRICKEGWLGKVLFTGFIHDEIFCEVHNSIDPMKWLKVTREEFEVKMDGWCPLYMGFGFGMCWYEAKSVELPIRLQWELVNKYGETGYPEWHGDGKELADSIPAILRDFHIRDCHNQLTEKGSQGKSIKPALNNELFDVIKTDKGVYNRVLQDYNETNESEILEKLAQGHVEGLLRDENGAVITELEETTDTQLAIDNFCQLHNFNREDINILNIEEATEQGGSNSNIDVEYDDYGEEEIQAELERQRREAEDARLIQFGMYLDNQNNIAVLNMDVPNQIIEFVRQHSVAEQNGYKIMFKSFNMKKVFTTEKYLPMSSVSIVQKMYIAGMQE